MVEHRISRPSCQRCLRRRRSDWPHPNPSDGGKTNIPHPQTCGIRPFEPFFYSESGVRPTAYKGCTSRLSYTRTHRFRHLELFARMTLDCLQKHPRPGLLACHNLKRAEMRPLELLFGHAAGLPSSASKGWKSNMPRAQTRRSCPLEFFARMTLDCLEELPRAGNRACHTPKRTDSAPWNFMRG